MIVNLIIGKPLPNNFMSGFLRMDMVKSNYSWILEIFSESIKPRSLYLSELEVAKKRYFRTKLDMDYAKNRGFHKQEDFETMYRAHLYVLLNQRGEEIKTARGIYDGIKRHGIPNGGNACYSVGLNSMDDMFSFLTNNSHCYKLGSCHASSETFKVLKVKTIYVDGSNVVRRGGTKWNTDIGQV